MPKASVRIDSNFEKAAKAVHDLTDELPKAADDAAKVIAHTWIRNAKRTMQRNGSVVTGTGIRSFQTKNTGQGSTTVLGADYLETLDQGSDAHYPDTDNYRFRMAAQSYGISRQQLAETIAKQGTRPHPWIRETTTKTNQSAKERLDIEISDAVSKAVR